ncbi:3-phosphoshikimate 1-carboxyvinyltransferase [Ruminococcus sp.]|uniref:3-phosphoshikimate 1-carboxyvinyltransferase n=1 Tax=Ruminococcus sp. TaxID=41978 RepID=UPI0038702111
MRVEIRPSKAKGTVTAPPSKSMAHRLLICAGLSEGESVVRNLAYSEDVKATIACLQALGAAIRLDGDTAFVKGAHVTEPIGSSAVLPCNECGSTLRFFTPICMLSGEERTLRGSEYLMTRPMVVYEEIAVKQDIRFEKSADSITVQGKLKSGVYEVAGNISSQFISGLLFALPLLDGDSEIKILPPVESKPYIDMTVAALREFGIVIENAANTYKIKGNQRYAPTDVTVEGDCSNAAFFEALNYTGSNVTVEGLREDSLQGDRIYKILFEKIKNGDSPIDIADCPDLGPILFAVAAVCGGARFIGTRRLKIKESDRAVAMKQELSKLGISVDVGENEVTVHGGRLHAPTEPLDGHVDHRIVMALSVLLTVTGGVIEGAQAVNKSFPDFFDRLMDLGVELHYGMD